MQTKLTSRQFPTKLSRATKPLSNPKPTTHHTRIVTITLKIPPYKIALNKWDFKSRATIVPKQRLIRLRVL